MSIVAQSSCSDLSRFRWFSPTLASDISRQTFVGNIAEAYGQYHLDGVDIDWEYPGEPGDPRNYVDSNDAANFLEFLKLLRATLPSTARISAAVQTTPFTDVNGQSMNHAKAFADVLDWILIMNYDTWGRAFSPIPSLRACPLKRGFSFIQSRIQRTP